MDPTNKDPDKVLSLGAEPYLEGLAHLDDIRPYNLAFPTPVLHFPLSSPAEQVMLHFLLGGIWYYIEIGHKPLPQSMHGGNILLFHLPQAMYSSTRRKVEYSNHPRHSRVSRHACEPHVNQLRDIEATMEVSTSRYGCWKNHSGRVDCLENALQVASSGDLLD